MHGLGDSADGYLPIFKNWSLVGNAKVVLLTAPT